MAAYETKQLQLVKLEFSLFWNPQRKKKNTLALQYSGVHIIASLSNLNDTSAHTQNHKHVLYSKAYLKRYCIWLHLIYATAVLFITITKMNLTNNTTNSTNHIIHISFRNQFQCIKTIVQQSCDVLLLIIIKFHLKKNKTK